MSEHPENNATSKPIAIVILLIAAAYFGAEFGFGKFTRSFAAHDTGSHEGDASHDDASQGTHGHEGDASESPHREAGEGVPTLHADHGESEAHASTESHATPHPLAVTPFVGLLLGIALFPLFDLTALWWESNRNRFLMAVICAALTLGYYFFMYGGWDSVKAALDHAIIGEYIPFIVLLFTLYVISGGIRIGGDLTATPATNTLFLIAGALLASFVGTTGAAMLLVRPLIDTNDERKYVQHTVVFFIFVVCNCGGCLLPIGDPPLFLGYLLGVKFLWTLWNLWLPWLAVNLLLITIYYLLDRTYYYPKEALTDLRRDTRDTRPLKIQGLFPNAWLLFGVILSIALLDPSKTLLGWRPWPFLREIVQLLLVAVSLWFTPDRIRIANKFNYHAIQEVAALFIGIFICMQPAIEILHEKGGDFGLDTPTELFWVTGGLSAVLDNAPTYVVFFETAAADPRFQGYPFAELVSGTTELSRVACHLLMAISLGAVFLGSMTYIGNGPNFMVRAIAEEAGIKMPSFFGYVLRYSLPILVPVFFVVTYFFLPS